MANAEAATDFLVGARPQARDSAPDLGSCEHRPDFTPWTVGHEARPPAGFRCEISREGVLTPPALDVTGYLECLQRCRDRFPSLRILSGVELSEPHRHDEAAVELLAQGDFDRILSSVHTVRTTSCQPRDRSRGDRMRVTSAAPRGNGLLARMLIKIEAERRARVTSRVVRAIYG